MHVSEAVINGATRGKPGFINPLLSQSQEISGVPDTCSDGFWYVCCDLDTEWSQGDQAELGCAHSVRSANPGSEEETEE